MAEIKARRSQRRQLGQFMTPAPLANRIVAGLRLTAESRVLEPSFGDGSFLLPLIRRLMELRDGTQSERLEAVLSENLYGVEIDSELRCAALTRIEEEFGPLPERHNLALGDFFVVEFFSGFFDCIVGNPPYGGTFDPDIEDRLDRLYGFWDGHKLKKETYSFFIARALDWLAHDGTLNFITSDTMLTIKTMAGLRRRLIDSAVVVVETLASFSDETSQPTLVLRARRNGGSNEVIVNGNLLTRTAIELTGNFSWGLDDEVARYFQGPTLGDYVIATSGMTIGRNELFLREIVDDAVSEPYQFEYFDDPITLARELERARLHKLSPRLRERFRDQESRGVTRRNIQITALDTPRSVRLPHEDYCLYNKATAGIVYEPPRCAVFWRNEGDAVLTFKRNGPWYLHGVGGQKFFGREGLTWQLISPRLNMRYLPPGYILDSGAPCLFLRPNVSREELWFVLGWCLTDEATRVLKTVINHTRNIQSKDLERMPYPYWVTLEAKIEIVALVERMVNEALAGAVFDRQSPEMQKLGAMFKFRKGRNFVGDAVSAGAQGTNRSG